MRSSLRLVGTTTLLGLVASMAVLVLSGSSASSATTYSVDVAPSNGISVTGTLTASVLGTLSTGDLTAWDLVIKNASGSFTLTDANSAATVSGNDLTATSSLLAFDFPSTSGGTVTILAPGGMDGFELFDAGVSSAGGLTVLVSGSAMTGDAFTSNTIGTVIPLPAALPLFATGLGAVGLLGWRRKWKAQAA